MTWTYDAGSGRPKDIVRLLSGDRLRADPLIDDEEIDFFVQTEPNLYFAAAQAAATIANTLSRQVNTQSGGILTAAAARANAFAKVSQRLRVLGARHAAVPYAGGLSQQEKADASLDQDRTRPDFYANMQSEPGTTNQESFIWPFIWPGRPF